MGIIKPITQWATNPWGQNVPIHIGWFLIWIAALAGVAFLIVHAVYIRYFAKAEKFEGDVSRTLAAELPRRIPRHSLAARLFHWIMAAAMFTLLFTAFLPRVGIQFDWVTYHWIAGAVLTASVVFHVIHASFWLDFWAIWPDKADLVDALRRVRTFMGLQAPPPRRFAKYPLENKLYHGAIIATGLSAIGTGVFMMSRVRTIFFPRNPYLFSDMTWGLNVRAARSGRGGTHRARDDTRVLRGASGEAGHYEVDDIRLDEARVLSGTLRPGAVVIGIAARPESSRTNRQIS